MSLQPDARHIEIVVAADEPALFFASIADAERDLEAVDVRNGVYPAAYGRRGEPYHIFAEGDRVRIRPKENAPNQADELATLLVRFLAAAGIPTPPTDGLPELLARCDPYRR